LFITLLLTAQYEDGEYRDVLLKRGQCYTGLLLLSQQTGLGVQEIRTAIKHLKLTGEITIISTSKYSVITIVKYNDYQQFNSETNKHNSKQSNKQLTSNQQATNNQLTTSKEDKEDKEDNITPLPPKGNERFLEFWKAYPKKIGKGAAEKSFEKYKPSQELLNLMLNAISKQIQFDPQWQKDNGQYIPNPATWLNQKRWEDEIKPNRNSIQPRSGNPSYNIDEFERLSMQKLAEEDKANE
jgi:hypothetical protein